MHDGGIILIKEGQLITGRKQLSDGTGIPESTIEDILKMLEKEHQIQQQKNNKYRIITILNWKEHQNPTALPTSIQQQADTYKNDKKEKNTSERSSQSIEIVDDAVKAPKQVKTANAVYEPLLKWAEEERGTKFVHRTKQYKALGEARDVSIKSSELKERWLEMSREDYWQKNGFDWTNVVASFNRKGV